MIATSEGPLWLSAIRDAFSRRVVAWETSARADADLVLTTLEYALASREVEPGKLVHHADHGCQYTSVKLTTRLLRAGVHPSMGSVGDSYDNALAENLWILIKTECIRGRTFTTHAEANLALCGPSPPGRRAGRCAAGQLPGRRTSAPGRLPAA
ncbi:DDE-type integrase/transposase/recombinase, partial [Streptomyces sp. NPDC051639]|uniref:DDE-type integrase/transposase/recombinase n=1 Tax=Streptomyces sp. NPDC051639 TaxID=3155671 RepID=UPI0034472EAC